MHVNLHNSPTVHHVHRCPYHVVMPTMCVCVHRHTYIRAHLTCDEAKFQMKTNTDQPQEVPSIDHHTYIHSYVYKPVTHASIQPPTKLPRLSHGLKVPP